MLAEITIRNFAIIDRLEVEFGAGMTVLSGETGAGKSILVDALSLILGDRADGAAVREGAERAEVSARFIVADAPAATAWLAEHELDAGDQECVIRRVIASSGRSRGWINGTPMPLRELRALGEYLVDIHGQHAHQSLRTREAQRDLLDAYGEHGQALAAIADAAERLRATRSMIEHLEQRDDRGESRIELLRYQVAELESLALTPNEVEQLVAEHKRGASAEHLINDGQRALDLLYAADDGAVTDRLGAIERLLAELSAIDPGFEATAELVGNALIQAREAADDLRRHVESLDIDPQRFAEVENRLGAIRDVARKHHVDPSELHQLRERLATELAELESADEKLAQFKADEAAQVEAYREAAEVLSYARRQAARPLGRAITEIIRSLGMPEGELRIQVRANASARISAAGTDQIEFLIAANPGQSARPLDRVASGGELSRVSLAIEVIAAARTRVPTLVFDEVDTGIGGGVAEIVGRQLRALGASGQSLCVTHLPQVAAQAQHHLRVAKHVQNSQTRTHISPLDEQDRVDELARMLGGIELTAQTRAHAADMRQRARQTSA